MTDTPDQHLRDEADYTSVDERRTYREARGYPMNARPFSAAQTRRRLGDLVVPELIETLHLTDSVDDIALPAEPQSPTPRPADPFPGPDDT